MEGVATRSFLVGARECFETVAEGHGEAGHDDLYVAVFEGLFEALLEGFVDGLFESLFDAVYEYLDFAIEAGWLHLEPDFLELTAQKDLSDTIDDSPLLLESGEFERLLSSLLPLLYIDDKPDLV